MKKAGCGLDKSFVKSAWNKLVLANILYKIIVIKFFWTIANIVWYVIMLRRS